MDQLPRSVIIDPPWPYARASRHAKLKGYVSQEGNAQYATMSMEDLYSLPVSDVIDAREGYLFLWTVGPFIHEALRCMAAWGFDYKSQLCWVKAKGDGKAFSYSGYGVGYWFRGDHELVLVGKRPKAKSIRTNARSIILAPRGKHSAKPEALHDLVVRHFPGPYLEIFGRRAVAGWHVIGNQAPGCPGTDIQDALAAIFQKGLPQAQVPAHWLDL